MDSTSPKRIEIGDTVFLPGKGEPMAVVGNEGNSLKMVPVKDLVTLYRRINDLPEVE